jgi:hypothetical protein
MLTNPSHVSEDKKCITTSVDQTHPMSAKTQNASQDVLTKPITCQRADQLHINLSSQIPIHATDDTKPVSTCVNQTPTMPAWALYPSKKKLTKPI